MMRLDLLPRLYRQVRAPLLGTAAIAAALSLLSPGDLRADVKPATIFGTHMVLQQGIPLPVWGKADPGEKVSVTLDGKTEETTADDKGDWKVTLPAVAPTGKPLTMTIKGNNQVVFEDVMVGEVWVASGQSNMAQGCGKHMLKADAEASKRIRVFKVANVANIFPQENVKGEWVVCDPAEVGRKFTGVGYNFAVVLEKELKVPVGIIQTAWGGTAIKPWIDLTYFKGNPRLDNNAASVQALRDRLPEAIKEYNEKTIPEYEARLQKWKDEQAAAEANRPADYKPDPKAKKPKAPDRPTQPDMQSGLPSAIHNGMVHPLIPYGIKGVLWYQGESNAGQGREYAELLPLLAKSLRGKWKQGDFPFLYVQLPAFSRGNWPEIRQAMLETLNTPNTGMAIILDLNPEDDLHPSNKTEVGRRLALLALRDAYGNAGLVASGPIYASSTVEGNKMRVTFRETGSGLAIGKPPEPYRFVAKLGGGAIGPPPGAPVPPETPAPAPTNAPAAEPPKPAAPHPAENVPTDKVVGFELAGADGKFHPATAEIVDATTLVLTSEAVPEPKEARYAWANYPHSNLYNKEGLPASPFNSRLCDEAKVRAHEAK